MPVLSPFTNDKPFIGFKNWSLGGTSVGGFNPRALFRNNEPGVWYDPSDVANLSWRRNLLTYSEQFDNAVWNKVSLTVSQNATIAPDGTSSAELITSTFAGYSSVYSTQTTVNAATYVLSVYAKAASAILLSLEFRGSSQAPDATFNLSTGTVTSGSGVIENAGNGWYRCSITKPAVDTAELVIIGMGEAAPVGTGIYIWGAQLETGSTATEYQRITDVHTEVRERFPNATLFQDTTGTQPVTTAAQSVALMLDKSRGLTLGPELVTNGTFDSDTSGWVAGGGASLSQSNGRLVVTSTIAYGRAEQNLGALTPGVRYKLTVNFISTTGASGKANIKVETPAEIISIGVTVGTHVIIFVGSDSYNTIYIGDYGDASAVTVFDNISVRELPGNHATQAITASRPIYAVEPTTGRRNLLTYSEQFDNAEWLKLAAGTGVAPVVTVNQGVAPDGTTTADRVVFNRGAGTTSGDVSRVFQGAAVLPSGVGIWSVWMRSFDGASSYTVGLTNGSVGSAVTVTGSWQRFSLVSSSTTVNAQIRLQGNITQQNADLLVWGAQLETGSTATAYQRVVSKYDVTEAGVPSRSYLFFDGVDDGMVTPTITPGIDKAQVFAGVRKLSDSGSQYISELGNTDSNDGTFMLSGNFNGADVSWRSKGTLARNTAPAWPAGNNAVFLGVGDIAGDNCTLRQNGAQVGQTLLDQGSGNFLAYPLYVGRRNTGAGPFNGHLYGLIVRFGANLSGGQVIAAERWLNNKTGAY